MNNKLRVMIVDDSVVFRSQIRSAVETLPDIEVVGTASNGRFALAKLQSTPADLMTLDLEMPDMNGLETLAEIKKLGIPIKVIVFSSRSQRGAEATFQALSLGAYDFVAKPSADAGSGLENTLIPKVLQFQREHVAHDQIVKPAAAPAAPPKPADYRYVDLDRFRPQMIVIGSSTGGPTALEKIFAALKPPLRCPILIAQHMPPVFTATLAQRLSQISGLSVKEAGNNEPIVGGNVYIAPGDYHLRIQKTPEGIRTLLTQTAQRNSVRPAVDELFESAAEIYGTSLLGLVLTGMGQDGELGAIAIKSKGGGMLIQDQASSVVFGMPGAVFRAGAYDRMASLDDIILLLNRLAKGNL